MAVSKVVRVEEVMGRQTTHKTSITVLLKEEPVEESKDEALEQGKEEAVEQGKSTSPPATFADKVYPLPENWPCIKQLSRPMSCALSRSRMPCVHKAVSHLELIQNIIEEWFKRTVEDIKSRSSTRCSIVSTQTAPKKQLRFRDPSSSGGSRSGLTSGSKMTSRGSSASLSVTGFGVNTPESAVEEEDQEITDLEVPYLGAEDVIDEVITLLARLEVDRKETQDRYQNELDTSVTLRSKIDDLCLRRLKELPMLVQREHEACIVDLNELQWHMAYTSRHLAKSQKRKDAAEVMNNRLKEDINFVKTHIPLVEEKLLLELDAMDRIKKAQVETNQELMTTKQRQAKTEQKSTEAMSKAETERGHIKRELDNVRGNLSQISEELSEAKMTFNSYVHQVNDIGTQLIDNSQELKVLEVKDANAKAAEEMQATKVRALQAKITDAEFEYRRLENEIQQAQEEMKLMKMKNAARLAELNKKMQALETKHRTFVRHSEELSIDIEDTQEKISRCDQQKIADDKNIRRIQREMERVAIMMQATMEEHNNVSFINHHIRDQLHSEQEKAFRTEESLKNTAETLRRQVKEEVHNRTVLQARIISDNAEIEKTRSESAKKKEKADKVADDVGTAVSAVLEKVGKLRSAKARKDEHKKDLETKIKELEHQYATVLKEFEEKLTNVTPHYNLLKEELEILQENAERVRFRIEGHLKEAKQLADKYGAKYYALEEQRADRESKRAEARETVKIHIKARLGSKSGDPKEQPSTSDAVPKKTVIPKDEPKPSDAVPKKTVIPKDEPEPIQNYLLRLRVEVSKLDKSLDEMAWKSDMMNKKIEEMDAAQSMMTKVSNKTEASVTLLLEEQEELDKQLSAVRKLGDDLRNELQAVQDRIRDGDGLHGRFLSDRKAVLAKQEEDRVGGLNRNKDLAARYRQLQNEYLVTKEKLLRCFDERLKLEATISDVKQLKSLQSKMHGALAEYFKLNGLYNEGELTRLEHVSTENGLRVGKLQEDMEEALGLITSFLQTEMDGTRARKMAWEAVQKMEAKKIGRPDSSAVLAS